MKIRVLTAKVSANHAVVRMKSGEGGCSAAVHSWEEGVYASYTPRKTECFIFECVSKSIDDYDGIIVSDVVV